MKQFKTKKYIFELIFLFVLGASFTVGGTFMLLKIYNFYQSAGMTNGTILTADVVPTGRGYQGQQITAKYMVNNKEYICRPHESLGHVYRQVGDTIPVAYQIGNPAQCRIDDQKTLYWLETLMTLLGIFFLAAAFVKHVGFKITKLCCLKNGNSL